MKRRPYIALLGLAAFCILLATVPAVHAAEPDPAVKKTLDKLLKAIEAGDREAFSADGTEAAKQGTTQQVMDGLAKLVGGRLKEGFETTYLCQLNQQGHQIHLWKATFKDGGDDLVFRMAIKDGKVAGFFLN
jgi:hypothetical protein